MQSPLKGQQQIGWTDMRLNQDNIPKTIERKRKGRGVDIISSSLPTPPSHSTQFPTPETVRRSSRPRKPTEPFASSSSSSQTHLPTPQTQRTKRRLTPPIEEELIPSPSGHTTFYLSSNNAGASTSTRPEKIRRRPGLTFAQQMGLLSTTKQSGIGVGIGMGGGHKFGIHGKVDQIGKGSMVPIKEDVNENPFLVSGQSLGPPVPLGSPGQITIHQPGEDNGFDSDTDGASMLCPSPRRSPRLASPLPDASEFESKKSATTISPTGLLSPPPTKHAPRIGLLFPSSGVEKKGITREEMKRIKKEEEEKLKMLDYNDNPFLVKPGESSSSSSSRRERKGPIINEDLPTVTYVFRGSKKVFANPLYPSNSKFPCSELNPEDDDFEPNPLPKPKLLFPHGPSPSSQKSVTSILNKSKNSRRDMMLLRTPSPDREGISPPSSPVSTPTTSTRFGRSTTTTTSHSHNGQQRKGKTHIKQQQQEEEGIFSDDEGELMMRNIRNDDGLHNIHEDVVDEEEETSLPNRRGLLFSSNQPKGVKRSLGGITGLTGGDGRNNNHLDEHDSGRSKKQRGLLRL
ncbi:uncharacterized protein L201_007863 [Kwoniella dendrophila CBS 6074]|uniref:Mif2 N-terminal domain-containing protein n=1 Tax=Kwoniella dendrophila CBS 6074 TaxID=1295534 RepID=A0AAX4K5J2_9TREE